MFVIYSTKSCTFCKQAKQLIEDRGMSYEDNLLSSTKDVEELSEKVGYSVKTVPQIWYGDKYIGGFTDLQDYFLSNT